MCVFVYVWVSVYDLLKATNLTYRVIGQQLVIYYVKE